MMGIIIQARTGSTRFPKKILKKIYKKYNVLEYLLNNLKSLKNEVKIVVATTNSISDIPIVELCKKMKIDYFQGDEADVQKRYIDAAELFEITDIIRIPSDNPFIIPNIVDDMIYKWISLEGCDYLSNVLNESYPTGMHIEIFTLAALVRSRNILNVVQCREHVTPGIYNSPDKFNLEPYVANNNFTKYRLTIDYKEDLVFSRKLAELIGDNTPQTIEELINIIENEADLYQINCKYSKSQTVRI